jgi:ABC-type glycerol-3-phosphate transport system permease component
MLTPAMATVAVLVFIGVWNDFLWNLVLATGSENRNAQVVLASFQGQFTFNVSGLLAGVTVVLMVPVALFLFTQRYAIAGLTGNRVGAAPERKIP